MKVKKRKDSKGFFINKYVFNNHKLLSSVAKQPQRPEADWSSVRKQLSFVCSRDLGGRAIKHESCQKQQQQIA